MSIPSPKIFLSGIVYSLMLLAATASAQPPELPKKVLANLDKTFPGWRLAEVDSSIWKYFQANSMPMFPSVIWGDFNGDKKRDYAVQIVYGDSTDRKRLLVAFLAKAKSYDRVELHKQGDDHRYYLRLYEKGKIYTDSEALRGPQYPNDTIGLMIYERGGITYVYVNGKFQKVISFD